MSDILYDGVSREAWVKELEKDNYWNTRHLYALFAALGTPTTLLDIGCGLGEMVTLANHMQIKAYGIDQLVDDNYKQEWFFHCDLMKPFSLTEHTGEDKISVVDMVLCWEVAEHIPDDALLVFCDTVCNHLKHDVHSYLIFTAAHPGQSGTQHINARPAMFWRNEFHYRGLTYEPQLTARLALQWLNINSPKYWLAANLQVFTK